MKNEVFLSFRGEDTRSNLTSHLYDALRRQNIDTFIDHQLKRGDQISSSLLRTIEESRISVIIFSERYASSRWCLQELVKILQCKEMYGQIVLPVFYHVDPSHVRNQSGAFGEGFAEIEKRQKDMLDTWRTAFSHQTGAFGEGFAEVEKRQKMLDTWRTALGEAAALSGFNSAVFRHDSELVQVIVNDILERLNDDSPPINKNLVGIHSSIKDIESLLCIGVAGVRKVGIFGMGGIGKTTIAKVVFDKISRFFESIYFVENIREQLERGMGLTRLRQEVISSILEDRHPNIGSTFTNKRLANKKVLLVFDDVTNFKQIGDLMNNHDLNSLGSGSRVIITTRDRQVLKNYSVDIYELQTLGDADSLQLFSQNAFKQDHPKEEFRELSSKVVRYAGGLPLALEILGSHLLERKEQVWQSAIRRLERIPEKNIQEKLEVSYDGLNDEEKKIFLDIACFFKGFDIDLVKKILDSCGFETTIGIDVLYQRSLITLSSNNITMHDLLQEMGRAIVRQESIDDPGKRSRLWHHEDIIHVLTEETGTEAIRSICLDMSKIGEIKLNPNAFSKMRNLRFLKLYGSHDNNKVLGFEGVEYDFAELRCLDWYGYPAESLPINFHFKKLVALDMPYNNIKQLGIGCKRLVYLKYINLSYSNNLMKIPDLSVAPNLESVSFSRSKYTNFRITY